MSDVNSSRIDRFEVYRVVLNLMCVIAIFAAGTKMVNAQNRVVKNSIGMSLAEIHAGHFTMGSPEDEVGRRGDEPQRRVTITRDYHIGKYEVTRGQFRHFVEATMFRTESERNGDGGWGYDDVIGLIPAPDPKFTWRNTGYPQTDDHPVVNVSWNDAVAFCNWLSKSEGQTYRLPTEAEFDYACRAGTSTTFYFGQDPEQLAIYANTTDAKLKQRFPDRNSIAADDGFLFTAPNGSYKPNNWGLHDMSGNVWEWTADWYHNSPPTEPSIDPTGPKTGTHRVIKGGDWYHDCAFARSASRFPIPPALCRRHAGFRVVRE
jgi:sulfatase modifying factor 1